jgi:hypothetical protein
MNRCAYCGSDLDRHRYIERFNHRFCKGSHADEWELMMILRPPSTRGS